ncbi:MAG: S1 RNA-binding domain-containing protein, partial [Sinobacterium sp.]|nr:S1 RNA-binding domain-containing protein [Sinobacterium sp.]
RADDATRDVTAWLKCEYLQEHIGDSFDGIIASVASFGFFVELSDLHVEGLVHVSQLGKEFFVFDAAKQRLIGERSHTVFHIGDKIQVKVSEVNLEERKVQLTLANKKDATTPKPDTSKKPRKRKAKNSKKKRKAS